MPRIFRTQAAWIKIQVLKEIKTSLRCKNNFFQTVHAKENKFIQVLKNAHGALSIWQQIFLFYT